MNKDKAYFFPRVIAYIIDIMIISVISTLICLPISNENVNNLTNELNEMTEKYLQNEISVDEFLNRYKGYEYDISYNSVPATIIEVAVMIGYFVVFQFYNKGQTIGKKMMKIRIISNSERDLTLNDYLYRAFLLNGVLGNMLLIFLVLFMNKNYFYYLSIPLQFIQLVLLLITIVMSMFKSDGRGLHDMIGNQKVVMID